MFRSERTIPRWKRSNHAVETTRDSWLFTIQNWKRSRSRLDQNQPGDSQTQNKTKWMRWPCTNGRCQRFSPNYNKKQRCKISWLSKWKNSMNSSRVYRTKARRLSSMHSLGTSMKSWIKQTSSKLNQSSLSLRWKRKQSNSSRSIMTSLSWLSCMGLSRATSFN